MLTRIADGVWVQQSAFCQSNTVVVEGPTGVLLIDPGVYPGELASLAGDLRLRGLEVQAGFSTHPHWDHLLWHADLGHPPRYATQSCAVTVRERLSGPDTAARLTSLVPPDILSDLPLHFLTAVTGLPEGTTRVPWDGPEVTILEHRAHAPGHAALRIEAAGVLVVGDMLSDILIPMLDLAQSVDPIGDYDAALTLLDGSLPPSGLLVPGHGARADVAEARERIRRDRDYLASLTGAQPSDDQRIGPGAAFGQDWLPAFHAHQRQCVATPSQ